jgi:high-affinity K+ transport system ATPase subunit B
MSLKLLAEGIRQQVNNVGGQDLETDVSKGIKAAIFCAGIVAVFVIILGGVNYMMSQGDSGKIAKAKNTIIYGLIGLIVTILAFAIVSFVLSRF